MTQRLCNTLPGPFPTTTPEDTIDLMELSVEITHNHMPAHLAEENVGDEAAFVAVREDPAYF